MKALVRVWFFLLPLVVVPPPGWAATTADFYTAVVAVEAQTGAERERGLRQGLADMLVKLSGSRTVLSEAGIKPALANPEAYVLEVGYTRLAAEGKEVPSLALTARYSGPALENLLRQARLPLWPANRPEVLVVLIEESAQGPRYVTRDSNAQAWQAVDHAMARRGVDFQVPLHDLEDQLALPASDAWAIDRDKLNGTARRYGVAHWLVLRHASTAAGGWRGEWFLGGDIDPLSGEMSSADIPGLFAGAVDVAIDRFSPRFAAVSAGAAGSISLVVENIQSYRAFSTVSDILANLASVTGLQVDGVDGDHVEYGLAIAGDGQVVLDTLSRDRRFKPVGQPLAEVPAASGGRRRFRWQAP